MKKNILVLFSVAFFVEALLLAQLAWSPATTPHDQPVMTVHADTHAIIPLDQTVIYIEKTENVDTGLVMLSVLFAMISGFIFGYVRYF